MPGILALVPFYCLWGLVIVWLIFLFLCILGGCSTTFLLLYVDDIILTRSNSSILSKLVSCLKSEFAMNDLGPLS